MYKVILLLIGLICLSSSSVVQAQSDNLVLARIKYRGGSDWYNDPSSLRNLIRFVNNTFPTKIQEIY